MSASGRSPRRKDWWEEDTALDSSLFRYRRLWASIVVSTSLVAILPLVIMGATNYYQYQKAFEKEVRYPIELLASNGRRSLEFFLNERLSAMDFIVHDKRYEDLVDQRELTRVFRILKDNHRDFVDIGVIDAGGIQRSYVGPFGLRNKNYSKQDWFRETLLRARWVSDVFLGFRRFPHFAIAVRGVDENGEAFVLRATFAAEVLDSMREAEGQKASRDTFIVNPAGVLQTPSKTHGKILERARLKVPAPAADTTVREWTGDDGRIHVLGYAYIKGSPYIYIVTEQRKTLLTSWFSLRNKLVLFLGLSMLVIILVILVGATYTVNRIREADDKRLALLHKVEYTAKMASIGRLAAGVAHEINNPLAIINEKAGLLKDLLSFTEDFPRKDKFLKNVDPILDSVERCARITRRLLRFAKHMDVRRESIDLEQLLKEVLGFLEKESAYRNLKISVQAREGVPLIESDRGRLQQVFLNIINNAFGAVEDGGRVDLSIAREGDTHVSVTVRDNGVGIPPEHIDHIFEPFFTTKEKHGTGLGLSITYGIVEKLGGKITVDSQVGEWTKFTVVVPIKPDTSGRAEDASAAG